MIEIPFTTSEKITSRIEGILTKQEVCDWLGITEATLNSYIKDYGMPCMILGHTKLFGKQALLNWVNANNAKK